MNHSPRILAIACLALVPACGTPLGMTSYPVKEVAGLEGDWALSVLPDGEPSVRSMRIERAPLEDSWGGLSLTFLQARSEAEPKPARYRAIIEPDPDGDGAEPLFLDGQIVQVGDHDYLTFQKASETASLPFYFLEVPIQNTVRFELQGDEMRLLWHEERYLWLPMAYSGEMRVAPKNQQGSGLGVLMSKLDAVFEAYEAADPEGWFVVATATRRR